MVKQQKLRCDVYVFPFLDSQVKKNIINKYYPSNQFAQSVSPKQGKENFKIKERINVQS